MLVRMKNAVAAISLVLMSLVVSWSSAMADANQDSFMVDGVTYDPSIPFHEDFLGHRLGEEPVRHHMMVRYIEQLAALSPRFKLEVIGQSHERRPILFLTISSPENLAKLDQIKAQHLALSDPTAEDVIDDQTPVVTWLNYGVHGAEASGMDAAIPTLYHLAAAQGPKIEDQLKNSVILVTAIFNPDGHMRRASYVLRNKPIVMNTDPDTLQHNSPWPGDRGNHYWFDLNRQWLLVTQPEARAWMSKWKEWRPNLTVDYHEMGAEKTYYFHPGVASRTNPQVPSEALDLINAYARFPRDFMDSESRLYFNEEGYDNFYVGKGSTYPLVNGGVGILYEAGAARGNTIETRNGLKSYRDNIRTHFRTSLASVEAGAQLKGRLLNYQKRFYDQSLELADKDDLKAYIVAAPEDPVRLAKFVDLLSFHRVQVHRVVRDVNVGNKSFKNGEALIIPLNQPQYRFIKSVMEHRLEFADKTFYDVSTWTLSRAFGLEAAELSGRAFRPNMVGPVVAASDLMPVAPVPDVAPFAYAFEWHQYNSPRALNRLLAKGVMAKVMTGASSMQTTKGLVKTDRGTIIVGLEKQSVSAPEIHQMMAQIAAEDGIMVHALTSGYTPSGPDLGSNSTVPLEEPHVMMAVEDGVSSYDAGEIWHLMDTRMAMKLSMRRVGELGRSNWSRYSHLVLPSGGYGALKKSTKDAIDRWVRGGGTLVAFKRAAEFVQKEFLKVSAEAKEPADRPRRDYAEKAGDEALYVVGGAIFESDLDISHPLGYGYVRRDFSTHKAGELVLEQSKNPYGIVAQYKDQPLTSGYASQLNVNRIAGTPMLIAERHGKGSIILFADNPNFRAVWYGGNKLFMNSLFFSKAFDAPSRRGLEEE